MLKRLKALFVVKPKTDYKKMYKDAILEVRQVEDNHMIFVRQIESVLQEEKQKRISTRLKDPTKITGVPRV